MANESVSTFNPLTTAVLLGVVLGPLAALSFGSRYADEETMQRARAGVMNATPVDQYAHYDSTRAYSMVADKTIAEITQGAGIFTDLQAAVRAAGAEAMLASDEPITVLAPSNEAFDKLSPEQRQALLTDEEASSRFVNAHIVRGAVSETQLLQKRSLATLSGTNLPVSTPDQIHIGDATVAKSIVAQNGMIHVTNRVLI